MKRGGNLRRSELKRGTSTLKKKTPLTRTSTLKAKAQIKPGTGWIVRTSKPLRSRSKTNANSRPATGEAALCRGQACYLLIPGIDQHARETVVPCHSNQSRDGKSMGMKAHDEFTVPGCSACHRELDQGMRFTREEKFALWDAAYARWKPVREQLKGKP